MPATMMVGEPPVPSNNLQFTVHTFAVRAIVVQDVMLLGVKAPVKWTQDKDKLVIELPHPPVADVSIYAFRVETKRT
jgi:hypothetical protein